MGKSKSHALNVPLKKIVSVSCTVYPSNIVLRARHRLVKCSSQKFIKVASKSRELGKDGGFDLTRTVVKKPDQLLSQNCLVICEMFDDLFNS